MNRGIYIVANDQVIENAIALLNSIRYHDPDVLVYLVPFNDNYQKIASILQARHQVQMFPDLQFVARFTQNIQDIFPRDFLNLPNKMRKFVLWFGPLDEFLYIDTDIIVFEPITNILDYLNQYEFVCCDYHYKNRKLADIFSKAIKEKNIFTDVELEDVFNSGFWASKKGLFTEEELYQLLRECAQNREYFDFTYKVTDQPMLNYVVLKTTKKRFNLVKLPEKEPGSWAGSKHFIEKDYILYDEEKPLRYLHWAGQRMQPGGAYRKLWEHYRYLGETQPTQIKLCPKIQSKWRQILQQIKKKLFHYLHYLNNLINKT
jgi:hypothetical protein